MTSPTCKVIRSGASYVGQQGFTYLAGLTGATAGSRALCMTVLTLPDGARANMPHLVINRSGAPCRALVAHSADDDQAGIVLLPDLDGLI